MKDGFTRQLWQGKFTTVDALLSDASAVGVSLRALDQAGITTVFQVENAVIAEMRLVENNDVNFLDIRGLDRSVWELRVVGGVDLALILALAFCRAAVCHMWRR